MRTKRYQDCITEYGETGYPGGTVKGVVDQIVVSIRSYPGSENFAKIFALYDIELGRIVM